MTENLVVIEALPAQLRSRAAALMPDAHAVSNLRKPLQDNDFGRAAASMLRAADEIERLRAALKEHAYMQHYYCEDCWYTCPKHPEGCCNEHAGKDCLCGADENNTKIDALLGITPDSATEPPK